MKLSIWVSVSDIVKTVQTPYEKIIELFDKKAQIFHTVPHDYIFQSLKKSGVEGVELLVTFYTSDKNIADVKKILNKNQMPVLSIHQSLQNKRFIPIVVPPWRDVRRVIPSRLGGIAISSESGILRDLRLLRYLKKKYQVVF